MKNTDYIKILNLWLCVSPFTIFDILIGIIIIYLSNLSYLQEHMEKYVNDEEDYDLFKTSGWLESISLEKSVLLQW